MCRRYGILTTFLVAAGLGILFSCLVGNSFWLLLIGLAMLISGILIHSR